MAPTLQQLLSDDTANLRDLAWRAEGTPAGAQDLLDRTVERLARAWPPRRGDEPVLLALRAFAEAAGTDRAVAALRGAGRSEWQIAEDLGVARSTLPAAEPAHARGPVPESLVLRAPAGTDAAWRRPKVLVPALLTVALAGGALGYAAYDSSRRPAEQQVARSSAPGSPSAAGSPQTTPAKPFEVPRTLPQGMADATLRLPPSKDAALKGGVTDDQTVEVTLSRGTDGKPVLRPAKAGAAALKVGEPVPGVFTAQLGGMHVVMVPKPENGGSMLVLHRSAVAKKVLDLLPAAASAEGVSLWFWDQPLAAEDFSVIYATPPTGPQDSAWRDTRGATFTVEKVHAISPMIGGLATVQRGWVVEGCQGEIQVDPRGTSLRIDAVLPDAPPGTTATVELVGPGIAPVQARTAAGGVLKESVISWTATLPKSMDTEFASTAPRYPGAAVKKITWTGKTGKWVWDNPTRDQVHPTVTCPRKVG